MLTALCSCQESEAMPRTGTSAEAGQSDDHQYAGKEWWEDTFGSGTVVDRDEWKQLFFNQK